MTGPFAETYVPRELASAPREWETEDAFADGFGFEAPLAVGRNARRKERMRLEKYAREAEDARDEDDWFARSSKARSYDRKHDRDASPPKKPSLKVGSFSDTGRFAQRDDNRRSGHSDFPEPMRETESIQIRGAARHQSHRQDSRREYPPARRGRDRDRDRNRDRGPRYHGGYS